MSLRNLQEQKRLNELYDAAERAAKMMFASARRFNEAEAFVIAHPLFAAQSDQEEKDFLNNTKVLSLSVSAADPFYVPPVVEENPQPI